MAIPSPALLSTFNQAAQNFFDDEILKQEQDIISQRFKEWSQNRQALTNLQERLNALEQITNPIDLQPQGIPTPSCMLTDIQVVVCQPSENDALWHLPQAFPMIVISLGNPPNPTITYERVDQFFQSHASTVRHGTQTILHSDHVIHHLTSDPMRNFAMGFKPSRSIFFAPYDVSHFPDEATAYKTSWDGVPLFGTSHRYTFYHTYERDCLLEKNEDSIVRDLGAER